MKCSKCGDQFYYLTDNDLCDFCQPKEEIEK